MLHGDQWATGKNEMVSKAARIPDVHAEALIQEESFGQSHFELFKALIFNISFSNFNRVNIYKDLNNLNLKVRRIFGKLKKAIAIKDKYFLGELFCLDRGF